MDSKIIEIFKNDLKSDKGSELDIDSLTSTRAKRSTDYKPYYQRNYVWSDDKASYLLESILLGYQIPPIIYFSRNRDGKNILEIIDGRQRYQTILRYIDNEFALEKKGLQAYENFDKKKFNDLEENMQERLLESTITQVKYSLSNTVETKYEDYVIKEIFRRYNSGITKMKTIDNERAEYNDDNLNNFFVKYINKNIDEYRSKYTKLFFAQKKQDDLGGLDINKDRDAIEELKRTFRKLYVMHLCPVKKSLSKPILLKNIFDSLDTNDEEELSREIENFDIKIKIIFNVLEALFEKDYFFKINKELTSVFYWTLSILEQEKLDLSLMEKYKELILYEITKDENFKKFQVSDILYAYKPFRFELFIHIIEEILKKENLSLSHDLSAVYINNKDFKFEKKSQTKEDLEQRIRVHTKEINIETFLKQIKRGKFIIRPQYQRNEVINNTKSSGIIESLLLDIKLPPIFVYKRKDAISEVIDGQQRLLSILGFLNEKYKNAGGELENTKKANFKLTGLKILGDELNNKIFDDLSENQQDTILDSSLSIIEISEEDNPNFDPISLFLRLNLKPYPIDENSFEMWNSYLDKELTDLIKISKKTNKSKFTEISKWAYLKKNAKRMENEEIYTILAHIDYKVNNKKIDLLDILDVHMKNEKIIVRLQFVLNKQYTTRSLRESINLKEEERKKFIDSLKNIKKMFEKIKMLLLVLDDSEKNLRKSFDILIQNKGLARKKYTFYLLYVLLSQIPRTMIIENRGKGMLDELKEFFLIMNDDSIIVNDDEFRAKIKYFIEKYTPSKRTKKLSQKETNELKEKQKDICPLCNEKIFNNDKIHIDHIKPISKGGEDTIENMQITHSDCNLSKGNRN
jgi:hypothetical protein